MARVRGQVLARAGLAALAAAAALAGAGCKDGGHREVITLAAIDARVGPAPAAAGAGDARLSPEDDLPAALAEVLGPGPGVPGPLLDGVELGAPVPAAAQARIAAFERAHRARVHYELDPAHAVAALDVRFEVASGLPAAVAARWGRPTDPWGSWRDPAGHRRATVAQDGRGSDLVWTPMRTIDELIAPGDPRALGFEPLPVVGARLDDLRRALGPRLAARDDDRWEWWTAGFTSNFAVDVTVAHGVVTRLDADLPATTPANAALVVAALGAKYGAPAAGPDGAQVWHRGGVTITAVPRGGTVRLSIVRPR